MANNEQIIENAVRHATAVEVSKIDKGDFDGLKKAAQTYLNSIKIISDMYEDVISKSALGSKIKAIYSRMRNESEYTQAMLKYQHEFETVLNQFLGRTIYLTYVKDDGSLIFYDDANIGKLYAQASANRGRGNISASKIFDANDLQEDIQEEIDKSMRQKQAMYRTAILRYHKNDGDEAHMNYNPSDRTFYWWESYRKKLGGWTDPIVNEGPIAEGYAGAVINNGSDGAPKMNGDVEHDLEILWKNYIGKDSIGAALKGDIVYEPDGSIQFAVKKGSFSTAMVRQYIVLAYNIMQLKRLTIEELETPTVFTQLTKTTNTTQKIIDAINEDVTEKVVEEIMLAVNAKKK